MEMKDYREEFSMDLKSFRKLLEYTIEKKNRLHGDDWYNLFNAQAYYNVIIQSGGIIEVLQKIQGGQEDYERFSSLCIKLMRLIEDFASIVLQKELMISHNDNPSVIVNSIMSSYTSSINNESFGLLEEKLDTVFNSKDVRYAYILQKVMQISKLPNDTGNLNTYFIYLLELFFMLNQEFNIRMVGLISSIVDDNQTLQVKLWSSC